MISSSSLIQLFSGQVEVQRYFQAKVQKNSAELLSPSLRKCLKKMATGQFKSSRASFIALKMKRAYTLQELVVLGAQIRELNRRITQALPANLSQALEEAKTIDPNLQLKLTKALHSLTLSPWRVSEVLAGLNNRAIPEELRKLASSSDYATKTALKQFMRYVGTSLQFLQAPINKFDLTQNTLQRQDSKMQQIAGETLMRVHIGISPISDTIVQAFLTAAEELPSGDTHNLS